MPRAQENPAHHPHDKGYKELLANKATFLELLKTFVGEAWTEDIREDDLTRVEKSYILQDFNEKESDIVYRLHSREDMVFYVLLELQSTVDYGMPFRLLLYMVEIWRDIYNNTAVEERERQGFRLPVIIPAVLYNGEGNWTAAQDFRAMLNNATAYANHIRESQSAGGGNNDL
ncbi:Rpn family recombination-promoting nuclease/putative transposase [Paradesulfitobacterium ferrireducens]|uniref:Rpn family recombination-promoting nuclease/putative transposase n=1 Tax=Paradesulfitobacterium ferrireducens TaxID=2816476 RepID=UPI001A8C6EEF|nr:Rpn family recombination-promoting nuclease/putative transposase [Paradesulfitobacterium ferrireducens]